MGKIDVAPKFAAPNQPPPPGAHQADVKHNLFLRFFKNVLKEKPESSKTVAQVNVDTQVSGGQQVSDLVKAEEAVILAAGNFLAETSRGAAVHGQNITSNAEATAALDKLFDAYEQYHNLLEEVRNPAPSSTATPASTDPTPTPSNPVASAGGTFTPKVPVAATGTVTPGTNTTPTSIAPTAADIAAKLKEASNS